MKASLLAISGPVTNAIITVDETLEVTVGRESSNRIVVNDRNVSRRHCSISFEDGSFIIRDLNSHNGTSVNGERITQRVLNNSDRIEVGQSVFVFITEDAVLAEPGDAVTYSDEKLITTTRLSQPGADPETPTGTSAANAMLIRLARDLSLLTRLATKIGGIQDLDTLQSQLVWALFEVLPVARCAVLLFTTEADEIRSVAAWNKEAPLDKVTVSRTVLEHVQKNREAVLSIDVNSDSKLSSASSFTDRKVRSVISAPILLADKLLGAIYAESSDNKLVLDDGHLQMLTAVGGIAALQIQNVVRLQTLKQENRWLRVELGFDHDMVGGSRSMRELIEKIARVSATDTTVLILGETGTGKELAARAIHHASARCEKAFIAVNCAALTESLLESELFGHEKGAFTGADARKRGLFEAADYGTIFLDEVGELAPSLQAKLLRVLQQREVVRLGSTQPIKVDVRVIAATNRDLRAMVKENRFREDLYYRLNVVSITTPPLRERKEDIPELAAHFAEQYSRRCKQRVDEISAEALQCLMGYSWPGNIRELENAIERAVVLGTANVIRPEDLPETIFEVKEGGGAPDAVPNFHVSVLQHKRKLILDAVSRAGGNLSEAARLLGLHPNYLHRLVTTMDLRAELAKTGSA